MSDLEQIMSEALDGTNEEPYSTVYMNTKLQEHFCEDSDYFNIW